MSKMPDFTKVLQDMMGASTLQGAFKTQAAFGEKFAKLALEASEKSVEISSKWTKETLAHMASVTIAKADASDYSKSFNDFTSATAESATDNMAAFAEVAKKMQSDTVALIYAMCKEASEGASSPVKKAAADRAGMAHKAKAAR